MTFPFNQAMREIIATRCAAFTRAPGATTHALKHAAVAITLVEADDGSGETALILTGRAAGLRSHGGQWALPGGRMDDGEMPIAAALRERVVNPRRHVILALLHRHAAIGNVASEAIKPEVVDALPGLLFITYITNGGDVPRQCIENIIDHVMIPLLTRPVPSGTGKPRR